MSVPYDSYSCSRCDYRGSRSIMAGVFQYAAIDGPVDVPKALGWCKSCSSLAPVEHLPTEETIQAMSRELADMRTRLENGQGLLLARAGEGESERNKTLREELSNLKTQITIQKVLAVPQAQAAMKLLRDRHSVPKCLTCGSKDIAELPPHAVPQPDGGDLLEPVLIGFKHPGCGGELLGQGSNVRIRLRLMRHLYDLDGNLISSEWDR